MPSLASPRFQSLLLTAGEAARITRDYLVQSKLLRNSPASQIGRDIKLQEDAASEAMIREFLGRQPDPLPVLGEEAGWAGRAAEGDELHWVIDPLDGSFNYFRGLPLYAVSIALCAGRRAVLGAIYDPERDELFTGGAGLGLSLNGTMVVQPAPARQMLATGFPSKADVNVTLSRLGTLTAGWTKMRMLGSAALSLAWTAAGRLDGYTESGIMWWDVAAGLALAEGAGARNILCEALEGDAVNVLVER
ncbi:inositol monophosphatase [Roseomonas sp. KE2513]|uniref:inositol monophosphatase family protein n=1 Tax=Roseomonas sp. KE2513 TaxID=2479202 RepID=UPI0018E00395|nr:inositol monophosphatase family protein [Roseomonas sp. KE2513]MBI0534670.1 inositol monophosphatase [Roseomonas sp. KE2513]